MLRQTSREIGVKGLAGARGVTVEGLSESAQASPLWFHGPGSGVALCGEIKEHSVPKAGWNIILLKPIGLIQL